MRRLLLIALLAAPAFAAEPSKFTLAQSGATADPLTVLGPASPCADQQIALWNGASNTSLQCSVLTVADTTGNLTGPSGGFTITGGTAASDALTLDSTSNATNGAVQLPTGNSFRLYGLGSGTTDTEYIGLSAVAGTGFTLRPVTDGTGGDNLTLTLAGEGPTGGLTLDGSDDVAGSVTVSAAGGLSTYGALVVSSNGPGNIEPLQVFDGVVIAWAVDTSGNLYDNGQTHSLGIDGNSFATAKIMTAVVFEGSGNDTSETTLTLTDPTADRTITLPDATGTVQLSTLTQLTPTATPPVACAAGTEGMLYLDSDTHKLCYCNGSAWVLASDDTTGCS